MSGNALNGFAQATPIQTNLLNFSANSPNSQTQSGLTDTAQIGLNAKPGDLDLKNSPIENGILVRNTGETLRQHVDRMSLLSDNFRTLGYSPGGVSKEDLQNAIVNAMGTGALQGKEAATLYGNAGDEPAQNAQMLQQLAGNLQNSADVLSPAANYLDTDPDLSGQASAGGISQSTLSTPYSWIGPNNQNMNGSLGDYLKQSGISTTGGVSSGGAGQA